MIICPFCKSQQFDGTIFCLECGASLLVSQTGKSDKPSTMQGITSEADLLSPPRPQAAVQHPVTDDPTLTLMIERSGRRLTVDMREEVLLGRADQARGITPDVDLGQDGGYEAGVSRRHAILFYRDGVYGVEDLGSANGTFVNGQRLGSQQVSALAHGDELRCGTLRIRVEIGDS